MRQPLYIAIIIPATSPISCSIGSQLTPTASENSSAYCRTALMLATRLRLEISIAFGLPVVPDEYCKYATLSRSFGTYLSFEALPLTSSSAATTLQSALKPRSCKSLSASPLSHSETTKIFGRQCNRIATKRSETEYPEASIIGGKGTTTRPANRQPANTR